MASTTKEKIIELINTRSSATVSPEEFSWTDSLSQYIDYEFTEIEAELHWSRIADRLTELEKSLGKKVNLYLAIVDYFTSDSQVFNSPVLVEIKVLREAEEMAMLDSLTKAFNRRYMDIFLRKEINRCNRYDKSFSIMLLDIDDFKKFNDKYGHVTGDEILLEMAQIFKSTIREEDVLCRYGGEEFLIIMPETSSDNAVSLFERIQEKIHSSEIFAQFKVTVSAGTANYTSNATNLTDLIRCADISLYQAKKSGKDRIIKFEK